MSTPLQYTVHMIENHPYIVHHHNARISSHFLQAVTVRMRDGRYVTAQIRSGVLHGTAVLVGVRHVFPLAMEYAVSSGLQFSVA